MPKMKQILQLLVHLVHNFAYFPLKCPAASKGETAELTFCAGGGPGFCHRNDTNAAKRPRDAAAVSLVSAAALFAMIFSGD